MLEDRAVPASFEFVRDSFAANENDVSATISVRRISASTLTETVDYAISTGSATAGSDFTTVSGTLTFPAGSFAEQSFAIPLLNDLALEGLEAVRLALTSSNPADIVDTATLVIRDDEVALPQVYVVTSENYLYRTNAARPESSADVTGIDGLAAGETIEGIDFRPATGTLYGLAVNSTAARLVTIDLPNGQATQIGATFTVTGSDFGFDFNPVTDRIRVVSDAGINLLLNPETGAVTVQSPLNPGTPNVIGAAYTNSLAGASTTTLYTIDSTTDTLLMQSPPADGTLTAVGPLGVNITGVGGFDIFARSGQAFATFSNATGTLSSLYAIDLANGAAERLGDFSTNFTVDIGLIQSLAVRATPAPANLPTISIPGDGAVLISRSELGPFDFTVDDAETPLNQLIVSAKSSNSALIPNDGIFFGGSGHYRNFVVTPVDGQLGTTTITFTVTDGDGLTATDSFDVTVFAPTPTPVDLFAVGTGPGTTALVNVYNADGTFRFTLAPFGFFTGGVTVATGDMSGDGVADIAVGAGPGGGPHVRIYSGATGAELRSFFAFEPTFTGGVDVALADNTGDKRADLLVGAGLRGGPRVRLFDGVTNGIVTDFFAYDSAFRGGVRVAFGDVNGDGRADIITGAGPGGGPHVRAFGLGVSESYFVGDPNSRGGAFVAAIDLSFNGPQAILASVNGQLNVRNSSPASSKTFAIGGTASLPIGAVSYLGADGFPGNRAVLIGSLPGAGSKVRIVDVNTFEQLAEFEAFAPVFNGGVFVGGSSKVVPFDVF